MEGIFQKEESPHDKEQTMPRASATWEQAQDPREQLELCQGDWDGF